LEKRVTIEKEVEEDLENVLIDIHLETEEIISKKRKDYELFVSICRPENHPLQKPPFNFLVKMWNKV